MVMGMVIYSALVRSHQSNSLVASASCDPRGYNTRAHVEGQRARAPVKCSFVKPPPRPRPPRRRPHAHGMGHAPRQMMAPVQQDPLTARSMVHASCA